MTTRPDYVPPCFCDCCHSTDSPLIGVLGIGEPNYLYNGTLANPTNPYECVYNDWCGFCQTASYPSAYISGTIPPPTQEERVYLTQLVNRLKTRIAAGPIPGVVITGNVARIYPNAWRRLNRNPQLEELWGSNAIRRAARELVRIGQLTQEVDARNRTTLLLPLT